MLSDRHSNPIKPQPHPSDAPMTGKELRKAVENGELGPVVEAADAAANLERAKLAGQASVRFTCQMLEKMARDLENESVKLAASLSTYDQSPDGRVLRERMFGMIEVKKAFRTSIFWLLRPMEEGPAQPEKANGA